MRSADDRWREVAVAPLAHRALSGATPDSPVNYSGAASRIPDGEQFRVGVPGAPDTVRWHIGQSGAPDQGTLRLTLLSIFESFSVFLLVCCEPLTPVELII
jgi:hypothetical protein